MDFSKLKLRPLSCQNNGSSWECGTTVPFGNNFIQVYHFGIQTTLEFSIHNTVKLNHKFT